MAPGKSGPHEMARGSSSLLSSHGRVIGPQDGLKKDSRVYIYIWLECNIHVRTKGMGESLVIL